MPNTAHALFVCSQVPSRAAHQAGHKTAFQYLLELSKSNSVDLIIICKRKDLPLDSDTYASLKKIVSSISIVSLTSFERLIGYALGALLGLPPRFSTRISLRLILMLIKLQRTSAYQKIWLEF